MAITDKLNAAWTTNEAMDAVFEVRAVIQNLSNVADETQAAIDRIASGASFSGVDVEIKNEASQCRTIVNALVAALAGHSDFVEWKQPTDEV